MLPAFVFDSYAFSNTRIRPATQSDYQDGQRRHHAGSKERETGQPQTPHRACGALALLPRGAAARAASLGGRRLR